MSYLKLIEKASEGLGFTSFKEGDNGVRRRPTPEVTIGQILNNANPLARNTRGTTFESL
jgi:hypothetical protein